MASGVPVAAANVGGVPELVRHEETGLLHAHENATELATQLERLVADPVSAEAMGRRARARIERSFSDDAFAANVISLYDGVVGPAGSTAPKRAAPGQPPQI